MTVDPIGRPLDHALAAAGRSWSVFPLAPGHKTPRRQLTDWETKATIDPGRITRWWERHPTDNIGIATGPSGLVVVDLDAPKPGDNPTEVGADLYRRLALEAGEPLPATWRVATPSGGWHLYYQAPAGRRLRNTAGRIGPRIDTRAHGGFVVGAGSVVNHRPYLPGVVVDPVDLPAWLLPILDPSPPPPPARPQRPASRARGWVHKALADEVQRVLDAPAGTRNTTLNQAAWSLGRLVAQGVLARHVVAAALQVAGEATGLGPHEAAATVRSALNARQRHHGGNR